MNAKGALCGHTSEWTGLPTTRTCVALLTSVALWMGAFATAQAATVPVTSTADGGRVTRDALAAAANGDTIDATGVSGTILLTSGELLVSKSVTILGAGPAALAVDGNAASRVFHVMPGNTVTISSLTITNGHVTGDYPGGGIYNDHATLTLSNCTVSDNSSENSVGGIFNDASDGIATLTILSSTVSRNSAPAAGGILNYGIRGSATLEISASTISDNSATAYVGGIYNGGAGDGGGGGGSASLTIVNSTLSGNSAGTDAGGILNGGYSGHGTLVMHACTLSGNSAGGVGGGIWNYGEFSGHATLEIGDTILNGSVNGNIFNSSGTVISDGYNLSSDDGGGLLTATGDQIDTVPLLGPLQDNGGPPSPMRCSPAARPLTRGKTLMPLPPTSAACPGCPTMPPSPTRSGETARTSALSKHRLPATIRRQLSRAQVRQSMQARRFTWTVDLRSTTTPPRLRSNTVGAFSQFRPGTRPL